MTLLDQTPPPDPRAATRDRLDRRPAPARGPYESAYDVSLGYCMDRPIVIP